MSRDISPEELELIGVGYTIATGNLWTSFSTFHDFAERILDEEGVLNTAFRHEETWLRLRGELERKITLANA